MVHSTTCWVLSTQETSAECQMNGLFSLYLSPWKKLTEKVHAQSGPAGHGTTIETRIEGFPLGVSVAQCRVGQFACPGQAAVLTASPLAHS